MTGRVQEAVLFFVETRIFPWKEWKQVKCFANESAALRMTHLIRALGMKRLSGGVDVLPKSYRVEVIETRAGWRVKEIGPRGAVFMVSEKVDPKECSELVDFLVEQETENLRESDQQSISDDSFKE